MTDAARPDRALDRFPHYPPGGSPHWTERGWHSTAGRGGAERAAAGAGR